MKKFLKKSLIVILSALMMICCGNISVFAKDNVGMKGHHIYVAPNGDDKNDGTKSKPFATIDRAKEYVKTLDKTKGDIVVEIADGTYFVEETLTFGVEDSGSKDCSIRYVASAGASPVISAGRKLDGTWKNEGNGIYSIEYNRNKKLRSLYVNGKRCYMTSNIAKAQGGTKKITINEGDADWAWTSGEVYSAVKFSGRKLSAKTRNPEDIEFMTQTRWNTTIVCVDSLEKHGLQTVANLQMPYAAFAQQLGWGNEYQFKKNNMIFNVFEWLDEAGEFYFDKSENKLYYFAREDEDLSKADVFAPEVDTIINIEGKNKENRVCNISFEGLTFEYTDWNLCSVDNSCGRATNQGAMTLKAFAEEDWHGNIYREYDSNPAAIQLSSANDISFLNNIICHTGNDGISLFNDVQNVNINGNIVYDTSGTALLIGHIQSMYIGDKDSKFGRHSEKEKFDAQCEEYCSNINITNNLFKNTSRMFWGNPGVIFHAVNNMNFQYNQIENTPYSGLSIGWGWWNYNGTDGAVVPEHPSVVCHDNKIVNNAFYNCITTLGDGGAIYTLSEMPETYISENYIKSIGTDGVEAAYHIRGIHIDEGTKHVYGEKNVIDIKPEFACIDCGDWGYKGENVWKNNYSTSDLYTTTETFENGTKIIDPTTVKDANWDKDAKAIIAKAGPQQKYKEKIEILNIEEATNIASIPDTKPNIPLIVGLSVGGVAILAGAVATIVVKIKKKKSK